MDEEEVERRVAPRAGRRARQQANREAAEAEAEQDATGEQEGQDSGPPSAPPRARAGFGFGDESSGPPDDRSEEPPAAPNDGFEPRPSPNIVPANVDLGGKQFTGVSRRKQDQKARENEEKEKIKSKYDELAERGQFEGIMEIEEEGKEDMSQMVSHLASHEDGHGTMQ